MRGTHGRPERLKATRRSVAWFSWCGAFLAVLIAAAGLLAVPRDPFTLDRAAERWVEQTLKKLTIDEKIGQLVVTPWFEFTGLQTTGHGAQEPIAVSYIDKENPITKGLADWTTIKEDFTTTSPVMCGDGTPLVREAVVTIRTRRRGRKP